MASTPSTLENTGHTFVPVKYYEPYVASTPTHCQMKRPSWSHWRYFPGPASLSGLFLTQ